MDRKLSKVLDNCWSRIRNGETVEDCLARHSSMRAELEPLLCTALYLSDLPKASASEMFRRGSRIRLVRRLRERSLTADKPRHSFSLPTLRVRAVATPLALTVVLILAGILILSGAPILGPQQSALASQCTLTVDSGSVSILSPGSDGVRQGNDGMTLTAGTIVTTGEDSNVTLTFFEGTSIRLEPGTSLEIERIDYTDGRPVTIVLRQWIGRTWSSIVKMTDSGSQYEIRTPSASAVVRGTLFLTEVDEDGTTTVLTKEGLVSVIAQGIEVDVPAGSGTTVAIGAAPSQPVSQRQPMRGGPSADFYGVLLVI